MMSENRKIQPVPAQFIERGIARYKGQVDEELLALLKRSECAFVPYRFADGRYLLVQPDTEFAFLYPDLKMVYEKLVLD